MGKIKSLSLQEANMVCTDLRSTINMSGRIEHLGNTLFQINDFYTRAVSEHLKRHPNLKDNFGDDELKDGHVILVILKLFHLEKDHYRRDEVTCLLDDLEDLWGISLDNLRAENLKDYKDNSGNDAYERKLFASPMPYNLYNNLLHKYAKIFNWQLQYADKGRSGFPILHTFLFEHDDTKFIHRFTCGVKNSKDDKMEFLSVSEFLDLLDPACWKWPCDDTLDNYLRESMCLKIAEEHAKGHNL